MVRGTLGAGTEGEGRTLTVKMLFIGQAGFVFTFHIIPIHVGPDARRAGPQRVDPEGEVLRPDIYRARVLNRAKLAYDSVAAWLDGTAEMPARLVASAASIIAVRCPPAGCGPTC